MSHAAHLRDDDKVTVCDACLRACCWQGEFMCDGADLAGIVEKTVAELRAGKHGEHEDYWATDAALIETLEARAALAKAEGR